MEWIACSERLPADGQRVLCWLPGNEVRLPGLREKALREVLILHFAKDWFVKNPSRTGRAAHPHFWLGEGCSNYFFDKVTHWMALPGKPGGEAES